MNTTNPVKNDIRISTPPSLSRSLRPVLLGNISTGRVGSPRALSFGWARTSTRRFGR